MGASTPSLDVRRATGLKGSKAQNLLPETSNMRGPSTSQAGRTDASCVQ